MKKTLPIFQFSIQNTASGEVDIHIDGDIVDASTQEMYERWFDDTTSVSFKSFRQQVESSTASTFNIYINSGGGSVTEAMAMHDLIVDMQAKGKVVNTIGRGIIASAATYILMAGNNPEMSANSWLMIHNVSGAVWGNVNEVENYATTLRQFNDQSRDFYASNTGIRKEDITKMMDAETWMPASDAKDKGFIKKISNEATFTQKIPRDKWQFQNMAVLNAYNAAVDGPPEQSHFNLFQDMKKFFQPLMDAINGVKPEQSATGSDIVKQIADAMNSQLDAIDTAVQQAITEAVATVKTEITDELKQAYDVKITALEKSNGELIEKNAQLEKDITNKVGAGSVANDGKDGVKPIGQFNKKS